MAETVKDTKIIDIQIRTFGDFLKGSFSITNTYIASSLSVVAR
jgi:hypothetical protein